MSAASGLARSLLVALAVPFASACVCTSDPPSQSYEFEGDCLDATCDFRAERGTIERVTSLLPGEHGVALAPETRMVRALESPWRGPVMTFLARCERETPVSIEVVYESSERAGGTTRTTRTSRGTSTVTSDWARARVTLPAGTVYDGVVTSVAVETGAGGRCVIDSFYVGDSRRQCDNI